MKALMVLNLIRLSNDLGSNLSVELLMFSMHKNSIVEVAEIVSEQPRLLELFSTKKCASRPKHLTNGCRDMPR